MRRENESVKSYWGLPMQSECGLVETKIRDPQQKISSEPSKGEEITF